ncbi:mucoidy inhibitor MuiA [Pelomyxa schiedti]|nr:mucoidy inhibitor MuiA [Pelomyxa schiedti]
MASTSPTTAVPAPSQPAVVVVPTATASTPTQTQAAAHQGANMEEVEMIGRAPHTRTEIPLKSCACSSVCVYSDRAEVTRILTFTSEKGVNDIVISGIPAIDENSVRVTGGTGQVTILEVSSAVPDDKPKATLKTESESKLEELERMREQERILAAQEACIRQERDWLNSLMTESIKPKNPPMTAENAQALLKFHNEKSEALDRAALDVAKELKKLRMNLLKQPQPDDNTPKREITVSLFSKERVEVKLQLSYLTHGASWSPSYDVRVGSNSTNLQLIYYGKIVNSTGEDWENAHMVLSTAQPAVGGEPPKLFTTHVFAQTGYSTLSSRSAFSNTLENPMYEQQSISSPVSHTSPQPAAAPAPPVSVLTTEAHQAMCAATFEVPHVSTIASDSKPHKVTVCIINLSGTFSCVAVPALTANAYLRIHVNNTSAHTILPGTVQVFVDNNYVTSSQLKLINPGEKFTIYLGVDSSIVVRQKPRVEKSSVVGMLRRSKVKDISASFTIKNTKPNKIKVTVYAQLPEPTDDRVKVTLKEPLLEVPNPVAKLNEFHNLVWPLDLASNQEATVNLSYTIDYPNNMTLSFM